MLVNIEPIQTGASATPNLWNQRFAVITEAINGNIDSDNLKNRGVTNEKIANGAVTSDKLAVNKYIDDNGWTVTDFGTQKTYRYQKTGTITLGSNRGVAFFDIPLPVGINNINDVFLEWSAIQQSQEIIYTVYRTSTGDTKRIYVRAWNTHQSATINNHFYQIDFLVETKA